MKTRSTRTRNLALMLGAATLSLLGTAAQAQMRDGSRMFDRMDADGDGVVTQAELDTQRKQMFTKLDANGDGMISAEEREKMQQRADKFRERMQARAGAATDAADTDGDGNISLDEFMSAPHPMVDAADSNGDGQITKEEFSAGVSALRSAK